MDLLVARASEALPPEVAEALVRRMPEQARAMAAEVARAMPHIAADADLEGLIGRTLAIAMDALRERRPFTAAEAARMNAIWAEEIATHGWSLDDVLELNRVVALAGWETAVPLMADVPEFDRATLAGLTAPLVRALDALGPYLAGTYAAASDAQRRDRRRRFSHAALTGSRSEGELRRQAREVDLPLGSAYAVGAIRAGEDLAARLTLVAMVQWEARLGPGALLSDVDEALVLAVPLDTHDGGDPDGIRGVLGEAMSILGGDAVAGVSAVSGFDQLPRGAREATATAALVGRIDPPGTVRTFTETLLQHLVLGDTTLLARLADEVLGPVLAERSAPALMETLEAYFAADGNASRVAADLGVHRHTVDYRLSRLRALLGRDRPLTRPEVQVALLGHRLLRAVGGSGRS